MNCLVTYASTYGSTKRYAQWIAEELSCDILESKKATPARLAQYDVIIHGGGLYAGSLNGVNLLAKNYSTLADKTLLLFSCGFGDPTDPNNISQIRTGLSKSLTPEMLEHIQLFHFRGGIDYPNLNLVHKGMMAMLKKMMLSKGYENLRPEDRDMLDSYGTYIDYVDRAAIQPLIDYVRNRG